MVEKKDRRGAPKGHPPYNKNGEGGRPPRPIEEIEKQAEKLFIWMQDPENYWLKDFCLEQNINPQEMSVWAKRSFRFSEVYEIAKHHQESKLFKGSAANKFNSKIITLALTNYHKWQDRQEKKITGDESNPVSFNIVNQAHTQKDLVHMVAEEASEYGADDSDDEDFDE